MGEAKKMVRSAKNALESVLDSTHHGVIALDGNGIIGFFNKAAERIFNVSSHEVLDRQVEAGQFDMLPALDRKACLGVLDFEAAHPRQLGQEREIGAGALPRPDPEGERRILEHQAVDLAP